MDDIQKEVLRENHLEIIKFLDLERSSVLDHLLAADVVSSDEKEEILSQTTPREQNAKLLYIIKRRESSSFDFLQYAMQEDYDFLATKLSRELTSYRAKTLQSEDRCKRLPYTCLYCLLLDNLIPCDITHVLFKSGLLSDDNLDYFNNNKIPRKDRISELLKKLALKKKLTKSSFIEKLPKKYHFIAVHAQEHESENIESCSCPKEKTSERTFFNSRKGKSHETEDIPRDREENTEKEDNLTRTDGSTEIELLPLQKSVKRTFPKDKRLMRRCSNLWNAFFELREKGDWIAFNRVTNDALKKFTDPDLLIMLYRSKLCITTFYAEDLAIASEMFDKAIEILPGTRMSNWHLARILPLKLQLLLQENKLGEASGVLRDAHQVIDTIKPCIATGIVHFFEGIYLSAILRNTPGGTKATAILERVKQCFLTSIFHFKKEKMFERNTSFTNQVYIFLVLSYLGVDFRKMRKLPVQTIAKENLEMACHYLDMFERECWESSTSWSQMLFYIGRAEEHSYRNNLKRSLDYFKQAKECAVIGGFKEHERFIDVNASFVSDKIPQNIHQMDAILQQILSSSDESEVDSTA